MGIVYDTFELPVPNTELQYNVMLSENVIRTKRWKWAYVLKVSIKESSYLNMGGVDMNTPLQKCTWIRQNTYRLAAGIVFRKRNQVRK